MSAEPKQTSCPQRGAIFVVGIGPGRGDLLTPQAREVLLHADAVVGYSGYFCWIQELLADKECFSFSLGEEEERAGLALAQACRGRAVAVISSGDPGIYGMAGRILEKMEDIPLTDRPDGVILPGVSAVNAASSLLGAPLSHDFAVISLSDLWTPWEEIARRLGAAAGADFVLALLNPKSQRRDWQLSRAREIILEHRHPHTPVGIVRNAYRPGQEVYCTTLSHLDQAAVDMFTTVIVGNSRTRALGKNLVTSRAIHK